MTGAGVVATFLLYAVVWSLLHWGAGRHAG